MTSRDEDRAAPIERARVWVGRNRRKGAVACETHDLGYDCEAWLVFAPHAADPIVAQTDETWKRVADVHALEAELDALRKALGEIVANDDYGGPCDEPTCRNPSCVANRALAALKEGK